MCTTFQPAILIELALEMDRSNQPQLAGRYTSFSRMSQRRHESLSGFDSRMLICPSLQHLIACFQQLLSVYNVVPP